MKLIKRINTKPRERSSSLSHKGFYYLFGGSVDFLSLIGTTPGYKYNTRYGKNAFSCLCITSHINPIKRPEAFHFAKRWGALFRA